MPVNEAFAALPAGIVESLPEPGNKDQLTNVSLLHVDDRKLTASMIPTGANDLKPVFASERLRITAGADGVSRADGTAKTAHIVIAGIMADKA